MPAFEPGYHLLLTIIGLDPQARDRVCSLLWPAVTSSCRWSTVLLHDRRRNAGIFGCWCLDLRILYHGSTSRYHWPSFHPDKNLKDTWLRGDKVDFLCRARVTCHCLTGSTDFGNQRQTWECQPVSLFTFGVTARLGRGSGSVRQRTNRIVEQRPPPAPENGSKGES
jgi:hypothetical protein